MVYKGHVKNGVVVLENGCSLPDGARLEIKVLPTDQEAAALDEHGQTLGEKLLQYAGVIEDAPTDLARQHDHYIHGKPKS